MKIFIALLTSALLAQAAPPMPVQWEMTTAAFAGRRAIVTLDTGARIEGTWLGVTPATFTIDIEKSRGRNKPPRGVQTIERKSIVELRLQEKRIRGRAWGLTIGYFGGMPLAYQAPAAAIALPVLVSVMAAGFFAGRALDKATREVHITPAPGE